MFQVMTFPSINRGYNRVFQPGRLSIGLVMRGAGRHA